MLLKSQADKILARDRQPAMLLKTDADRVLARDTTNAIAAPSERKNGSDLSVLELVISSRLVSFQSPQMSDTFAIVIDRGLT
jgi:hypothetical protein